MTMDINWQRLVQSCNSIDHGKQLHVLFVKKGLLSSSLPIANCFLQMYLRCGEGSYAHRLFDEMPSRNYFSWNTMIEAYMKWGYKEKSLELFYSMPASQKNDFSWNLVVSGLAKDGQLEVARSLFDRMPRKTALASNSMFHGYVRNGCALEAIKLFKELNSHPLENRLSIDSFILTTIVGACAHLAALQYGKQVHSYMLTAGMELDHVLSSSLVNLYSKCGDLVTANRVVNMMNKPDDYSLSALIWGYANCRRITDARRIFNHTTNPCVTLWNSMISAYVSNNDEMEALLLFHDMQVSGVQPDSSTLATVLSACNALGILEYCEQLHGQVCKFGLLDEVTVASALVDSYAKCGRPSNACNLFSELRVHDTILLNTMITTYASCGRVEDAKKIFNTMPNRSLISWNSMIVGFSQNGCPMEALDLFCKMNKLDLRLDRFSLASVISACGGIASIALGEQVFARVVVTGYESDQIVSTSMIDFYSKCGFLQNGRKIFDAMTDIDVISWNSMMMGYATNGSGYEALALFNKMKDAGVAPTNVTFTAVLSACDHCGLVEEGRKWLHEMKWKYHIEPELEHYSCMVDLLARVGYLEEAVNLIKELPFGADSSMWSSVLRGCVIHGEKSLGKKVAERVLELDPANSAAYVQLSILLAGSEDWERSSSVRREMREKQVKKNPGFSWAGG